MREVARSRNLLSGFVTTFKRLFESVVGTLFCLLLYVIVNMFMTLYAPVLSHPSRFIRLLSVILFFPKSNKCV